MPSIAEAIGEPVETTGLESDIGASMGNETVDSMEQSAENTGGTSFFDRFDIFAETGDGPISDYMDHPLNFNNSKSMARIIRGATGMLGKLNLAIVDIGVGVLEFAKGRGKDAS